MKHKFNIGDKLVTKSITYEVLGIDSFVWHMGNMPIYKVKCRNRLGLEWEGKISEDVLMKATFIN